MATKQFYHDIDLVKVGQLVDARIQNVSDAEESALAASLGGDNAGLVIYNTTTTTLKIWDGSEFKSVSSDIDGDIVFKGVINPTNLATKVAAAKKGHQFVADVAADLVIGGTTHTVEVGDVVLFVHEEGATEEVTVFNRNIDAATTDVAGIVELADVAETSAGTAGDRAITPASFAGSTWATRIGQAEADINANASEIDDLELFVGEGTSLDIGSSLADAVNQLKDRADSADGEIDSLEAFAGEGVTLKTAATTLATAINELVDADSDASDRSAAIEADVATLQTDVGAKASLDTDVKSSLVAAINELHGEIDDNAADIAANAAAIQTNATGIATNLQSIEDNDSDILSLQGRVTQVETDLQNSVATDVAALQAQIDSNDTDIINLQSQITSNDGEISTLQTEMDAVEGRATALELADSAQDVRLDALETEQGLQAGRLTVNEGDIDALELAVGTVGDLDTTATDLVAAINEIHDEADLLDGRMSTAESEIQALEDQAGTETLVTVSQTLSGAVNELKGRADGADADITTLEGRADVLEARDNIGSFTTSMSLSKNGVANTVTHNIGLASSHGFVVNVLDSDMSQISVDIVAKDANSFDIFSLVDLTGVKVSVMGKKS